MKRLALALVVLLPALAHAQAWQPRTQSYCNCNGSNGGSYANGNGNGVSVGVSLRCVGYTQDGQPLYVVNGGKRNGNGGNGGYDRTVQVDVRSSERGPVRPALEPEPQIPLPLFILVYRFKPNGERSFEFQHFDDRLPPRKGPIRQDIGGNGNGYIANGSRPRVGEIP